MTPQIGSSIRSNQTFTFIGGFTNTSISTGTQFRDNCRSPEPWSNFGIPEPIHHLSHTHLISTLITMFYSPDILKRKEGFSVIWSSIPIALLTLQARCNSRRQIIFKKTPKTGYSFCRCASRMQLSLRRRRTSRPPIE